MILSKTIKWTPVNFVTGTGVPQICEKIVLSKMKRINILLYIMFVFIIVEYARGREEIIGFEIDGFDFFSPILHLGY